MKDEALTANRPMTVEEYIAYEERADVRDLENRHIKKYPLVIFEVLSKTSRLEDSSDKFIRYKNIGSLRNYILIDSQKRWCRCVQNARTVPGRPNRS